MGVPNVRRWAVLGALLWMATPAHGQFPRQAAQQSLQRLEQALAGKPEAAAVWESYLNLPGLRSELARGAEADAELVGEIANRLAGLEEPPDPEALAATQEAVEAWLEMPLERAAITRAQRALRTLQTWIRRNRSRAGGWDDFLELNRLNVEFRRGEQADLEWVRELLPRFEVAANFQASAAIFDLERALRFWQAELEQQLADPLAVTARAAKAHFSPVPREEYQQALQALRTELAEMDQFLQSGGPRKETGWKDYLDWRSLRQEVLATDRPRLDVLQRVLDRLSGDVTGLDRRPFVRLQRRLRSFITTLRVAETSQGRLQNQVDRLRQRVEQLEQYLASGGPRKESGWKSYLQWEQWRDELNQPQPDPEALYPVVARLRAEQTGLERAPFRQLEMAASKYLELYSLSQRYSPVDEYVQRLESLARALEHRQEANPAWQAELRAQLEWLSDTGQAPWLVQQVVGMRRQPNLQIQASGRLLVQQIQDVVNERNPVGRCFEGSWVTGTADTQAAITAQLIPSAHQIVFDIVLNGTTFTNSIATQRSVQVHTNGNTWTQGRKRVFLDEYGLRAAPATAVSSTNQQINGIQVNRRLGRRLITRVATRRAYESRPRAERVASSDTSQQIRENMDRQAADLIQRANQTLEARVSRPLRANNVYPEQLHFASTATHMWIYGIVAPGDALGAESPAPALPIGTDVGINAHQTAINNVLAEYLGDITVNGDQMQALMERYNIAPPMAEPGTAEEAQQNEPWSITFDHLQPATVQFDDQHVTIAIVGRRFTRGADEILDRIRIGATYRAQWNETDLTLVRVGDVAVDFVDVTGQLTNEQLAYKSFLGNRVEPMFREQFTTRDLPQNEATSRLEAFRLLALAMDGGWVTLGLNVDTSKLRGLGLK